MGLNSFTRFLQDYVTIQLHNTKHGQTVEKFGGNSQIALKQSSSVQVSNALETLEVKMRGKEKEWISPLMLNVSDSQGKGAALLTPPVISMSPAPL